VPATATTTQLSMARASRWGGCHHAAAVASWTGGPVVSPASPGEPVMSAAACGVQGAATHSHSLMAVNQQAHLRRRSAAGLGPSRSAPSLLGSGGPMLLR
jgi:hypothetical protein